MATEVKITMEETSFVIEGEGKKLRVSYEERDARFSDAMQFCKDNGGGDETVENMRFLARHRETINKALVDAGKTELLGWYWTNERTWWSDDCAFVVNLGNGNVYNGYVYNDDYVRSVSEFHIKTMNTNYPISLESLFEAYKSCRKGNSRSLIAQRFFSTQKSKQKDEQ